METFMDHESITFREEFSYSKQLFRIRLISYYIYLFSLLWIEQANNSYYRIACSVKEYTEGAAHKIKFELEIMRSVYHRRFADIEISENVALFGALLLCSFKMFMYEACAQYWERTGGYASMSSFMHEPFAGYVQ